MKTQKYRVLYRSRYNKKIAGICGGIAEYFNVDPIWIRLMFVLFFLAGGSALLVYIIMWILVPYEPIKTHRLKDDHKDDID